MSRQDQDSADAIAGCVIGLLWAMTAGLIALVVKSMQTPPEVQLRQLGQTVAWGSKVETVTCTHCRMINELGQERCYACGSSSIAEALSQQRMHGNANGPGSDDFGNVAIVVVVLIIVIILAYAISY